jgi:hypothetical protein
MRIQHICQKTSATHSTDVSDAPLYSASDPAQRYHIGISQNLPQDIGMFLRTYPADLATKVSPVLMQWLCIHVKCQDLIPKLKQHLLSWLEHMRATEMPSSSRTGDSLQPMDIEAVFFQNNIMYQHNILQANYTTYDVRRAQDTINPKTDCCDVMLLSEYEPRQGGCNLTSHPYQYTRALGIYHVNLIYNEPTTHWY